MNVRQISRYAGKENKRKPQRNKVCIVTTKRISIGKTHFINKQLKYTNISVFLVYLLVPLLVLICSLMCCVCVCFFHSFWNTLRAQPLHKFKLKRLLWLIYSCIQTYWLLIYCLDRTLKLPYTHISMPQYFNATHTHTAQIQQNQTVMLHTVYGRINAITNFSIALNIAHLNWNSNSLFFFFFVCLRRFSFSMYDRYVWRKSNWQYANAQQIT